MSTVGQVRAGDYDSRQLVSERYALTVIGRLTEKIANATGGARKS
jgi:hypothetical protein